MKAKMIDLRCCGNCFSRNSEYHIQAGDSWVEEWCGRALHTSNNLKSCEVCDLWESDNLVKMDRLK